MPVRQRRARSTTDPACIVVILRRESGPGTWWGWRPHGLMAGSGHCWAGPPAGRGE